MNWRCDLYCYEHVDGYWVIHVAGNRVQGDIPEEPDWALCQTLEGATKFTEQHKKVMVFLETAERKEIDLPHCGDTFECRTLKEFRDRLLELRQIGYNFPDVVLEDIEAEMRGIQ